MPTSTVNKDTAREILEKHRANDSAFKFRSMTDNHVVLAAMREIASLTWDACAERKQQEWRYIVNLGNSREETTAPDKETYLNNLFPNGN